MPKIGNQIESYDIPCDRCNSPRKVSKTWTEKIKNEYGTMVIHHSQIICTNVECQKVFDKKLKEEVKKRKELQQIKQDNADQREAAKASLKAANASRV